MTLSKQTLYSWDLSYVYLFFFFKVLWKLFIYHLWAQRLKHLPAMRKTWVQSLDQEDPLGKKMATHSNILAWNIPWMEELGGLQSIGLQRVRHDWATSFSLFTFMHWRRKWQPTPIFLLGESQRQRSLAGSRLWGRTESDTTEVT